jgi:hypothetical protein
VLKFEKRKQNAGTEGGGERKGIEIEKINWYQLEPGIQNCFDFYLPEKIFGMMESVFSLLASTCQILFRIVLNKLY